MSRNPPRHFTRCLTLSDAFVQLLPSNILVKDVDLLDVRVTSSQQNAEEVDVGGLVGFEDADYFSNIRVNGNIIYAVRQRWTIALSADVQGVPKFGVVEVVISLDDGNCR